MTISLRNTPSMATQLGTSATISVAGSAWGTAPVAGDLLVAVFTISGNGAANLGSTPGGWTLSAINIASTDARTVVFTKVAAGSDAVPTCAGTITSGTAARCAGTVTLYDFYDSGGVTPQLATYGTASGTTATMAPVTSGTAIVSGSYAVASIAAQATTTGTITWTTPSGWTNRGYDTAGTTYFHFHHWSLAAPATGATLTCSMAHTVVTTAFEAAMVLVVEPAVSTTVTMGSALAVTTAQPAPAVSTYSPETSPSLELSGFSFSGIGSSATIEYVQLTVTQYASTAALGAPSYQLWDYSGTPAQIGGTVTGSVSTTPGNADTATFTGVTYAQLATLRVRVFASSGSATAGAVQYVDAVTLTACYMQGPVTVTVTPATVAVTTAFPAPGAMWTLFGGQAPSGGSLFSDPNSSDIGVQFSVTGSGNLLAGYSFWLTPAAVTAGSGYSFRLYSTTDGVTGTLISGSSVAGSGTWTAGAWNTATLVTPVALTAGVTYVAAVTQPGPVSYYYGTDYWFSSGPGGSGTTSGPLSAPGEAAALGHNQGTLNEPATGGIPQETTNNYDNFWIDVLVTQPAGVRVVAAVVTASVVIPVPPAVGSGDAVAAPGRLVASAGFPAPVVTVTALPATLAVTVTTAVPGVNTLTPVGNPSGGPWVLLFDEEFADPKGISKPDPATWATCLNTGDMWRSNSAFIGLNGECEWYPHNLANTSVTGGNLVLTASHTSPQTADPLCPSGTATPSGETLSYTSGMISSHPSFRYTYGYAEARIKLPSNAVAGIFPAFYMVGSDQNWPPEADICEDKGPPNAGCTWWPDSGSAGTVQYPNDDGNFHTYGFRWTPTDVTFFFDGAQRATYSTPTAYPMFLILEFAVTTAATGTGFPCSLTCDYIRVWQNTAAPAAPTVTSITPASGIPTAGTIAVSFNTVAGATSYRLTSSTTDYYADVDQTYATTSLPRASNTGTSSPVTISGLTNGVRYNVTAAAYNSTTGLYSAESPAVPQLPTYQTAFVSVTGAAAGFPPVTVATGGGTTTVTPATVAVTTARPAPVVSTPVPAAVVAVTTARPAPAVAGSLTAITLTAATTQPAVLVVVPARPAVTAVTTAFPAPIVNPATLLPVGNPSGGPWVLSFAEEFSDPRGIGKPDLNTWASHYIEGDTSRQETAPEIEWSPHNMAGMSVSGGQLGITASYAGAWPAMLATDPDCPNPSAAVFDSDTTYQPQFVSGILSSHPSFQQTYGYFEARLQVPSNGNNWAGFWMNCSDGGWPPEIDIVEQNGSNSLTFAYHPPSGSTYTASHNDPGGGGDFTQWHVFGCRWTPTDVTFFNNGVQQGTTSTNIATNPMHVMVELAVRDSQHGSGSGYPCTMNVDYVRCWTKSTAPPVPAITAVSPSTGIPSSGSLQVSFGTVAGAASYRVAAHAVDANVAFGVINAWQAATSAGGSSNPITVTGLTNGVPYNVTVSAVNAAGYYSPESAPVPPVPAAGTVFLPALGFTPGFPAATVSTTAGAVVTPATLAVTTAAPAPAVSGSLTASALAATTSQPAVTVTTSGNASVSPGTVTASASVPAPAVSGAFTAAALAVASAVPGPAVSGSLTGSVLAVSTSQPAPAAVSGGLTAGALAVSAGITTPAVSAGGSASVAPAVLAVTANVPAPVVRQDQNVTASAAAVTTARPAPAVSGGLTLGSALAVSAGIATPAVTTSGNANASPAVTAAVVTIPAPVVRQDQSLIPAAVAVTVAVPAAAASGSARPPVAVITILAAFPATAASGGATLAPAVLAVSVSVPLPVPPFTVGTLTATDSAGAGGTLTASDTRTGGPS